MTKSLLVFPDDLNKLSKDKAGSNPLASGLNDTDKKKKGKFKSVFGFIKNVGNGHAGDTNAVGAHRRNVSANYAPPFIQDKKVKKKDQKWEPDAL